MSVAALWRGALRHIGWVLGLSVIAIVVGAVLRIGDLHAFATMLENAHPGWLLVALGMQATTYASVAAGWKIVLGKTDTSQPRAGSIPSRSANCSRIRSFRSQGWVATCSSSTS